MPEREALESNFSPASFISTCTGFTAPVAAIMVAVPTSNTCMMCGALPARNAAMPAFIVSGHATCGFSNAWVTWVNVEQMSAWHNVPLSTKANGLDGFDTVLNFNGPLHTKHLANLIELEKEKVYSYSGRTNTGEGRFTSGECPIFLTSSGFFGNVKANEVRKI